MRRELIQQLSPECVFSDPATQEQLEESERVLQIELPDELRILLLETNGVYDGHSYMDLVWTCAEIVRFNLEFRSHPLVIDSHMPFDNLLFFSHAGNGDMFGLAIILGKVTNNVFAWNHEDDSRVCVARSLRLWLEGWLSGELKI